jgi:hypothetical protein
LRVASSIDDSSYIRDITSAIHAVLELGLDDMLLAAALDMREVEAKVIAKASKPRRDIFVCAD